VTGWTINGPNEAAAVLDLQAPGQPAAGIFLTTAGRSTPYLVVDARYEKVRKSDLIRSRAALLAIGIDWDGRRQVLGVELANRESSGS
jgi:hypothetical protein